MPSKGAFDELLDRPDSGGALDAGGLGSELHRVFVVIESTVSKDREGQLEDENGTPWLEMEGIAGWGKEGPK